MSKPGPSRLTWFPFYVDDFLGGTSSFLQAELGAYLQALLAQWQSKDLCAIPDDAARLSSICRGPMPKVVRSKFTAVTIEGAQYLRNERLAREWERAKQEHANRLRRAKAGAQAVHQAPSQAPLKAPLGGVLQATTSHMSHEIPKESLPTPQEGGAGGGAAPEPGKRAKSRYSAEQCVAYGRTRGDVHNPEGWGRSIYQSGKCDAMMDEFFQGNGSSVPGDTETPMYLGAPVKFSNQAELDHFNAIRKREIEAGRKSDVVTIQNLIAEEHNGPAR